MLQIKVPAEELWDESSMTFKYTKERVLQLEHSLISISKWEAKWHKPYLETEDKTEEQMLDYIRCMTISKDIDENVYLAMRSKNFKEITDYISDPMTATWFAEEKNKGANSHREKVTSELIYYWMVAYNIPFECEKWHISRLLTLIRICEIKNRQPEKRSKSEIMRNNAVENAKRKARLHTRG